MVEESPGYCGTISSGRFQSFPDRFLQTSSWKRSGTDRIFPVQFRPESGGKEPAGIGENCAGIGSDFNGCSRRNDRPGEKMPEENLNMNDVQLEDDEEINEMVSTPTKHVIPIQLLVEYVEFLCMDGVNPRIDSFVTPILAKKVIDFVYLLKDGRSLSGEETDTIIRKWLKNQSSEKVTAAFNNRTKTVNEIIDLLQNDCQLNDLIVK
ncbi:unnamed protein product [Adineta ricciae]|uniref:Uncharacterized protein n=1 Tax=Adineta ricciae TaxID=249248 RepID=A0A815PD40_ADIRI|nr:unnamed protein product [Adineta ricciae]CAF1447288.1 unnamed protein product [Adineta ricciae]